MKKWIYASITVMVIAFFTTAFAQSAAEKDAAHGLIENWFAAMKANNMENAASYLAPQFTSIHTDGIVRDKEQEIALMKGLHMKNYHLTDFQYSQSGSTIVVTYKDQGSENIDNQPINPKAAGRMAVLQKQGDRWLIIAYANLDAIS